MSLRYAVLGLLERAPSTGYELSQMFDLSLRTAWHAGHSQIYPELVRMESEGLVEVVARGARGSKTYALTDAGRSVLRNWLVDTGTNRSIRDERALRFFLNQLLPDPERRAVFHEALEEVEAERKELLSLRDRMADEEPFAPQVELGLAVSDAVAQWLREQVAR